MLLFSLRWLVGRQEVRPPGRVEIRLLLAVTSRTDRGRPGTSALAPGRAYRAVRLSEASFHQRTGLLELTTRHGDLGASNAPNLWTG